MALAIPHRGWENEHLATFLLSRLAFVAAPITVADDVGTDLFCTLFERVIADGRELLEPRSSIAVQVKSSSDPVDVAGTLAYLRRLEMPYYLGVVDQEALTIAIYSARFLPLLLSLRGIHAKLELVPSDTFVRDYRPGNDSTGYSLICPKVATLKAQMSKEDTVAAATLLRDDAAAALTAITSRHNKEYIFEISGGEVEIFTGPDSMRTFRPSFYKRLTEALMNLARILEANGTLTATEVDAYLGIADALCAEQQVPAYLVAARNRLRELRGKAA